MFYYQSSSFFFPFESWRMKLSSISPVKFIMVRTPSFRFRLSMTSSFILSSCLRTKIRLFFPSGVSPKGTNLFLFLSSNDFARSK